LSGHQRSTQYSFWLPTHKADTIFEGNKIVVCKISGAPDPLPIMAQYIKSRDAHFSFHPQLWLKADRTIPLRSWFVNRLSHYFGPHITGQSMRAGGTTAMAEAGAVPELIKGAGRWSSTAFERYIRKNPIVLHALILYIIFTHLLLEPTNKSLLKNKQKKQKKQKKPSLPTFIFFLAL
jgi:hypothetical protein